MANDERDLDHEEGDLYDWNDISRDEGHLTTPAIPEGEHFAIDSRGQMGMTADGKQIGFEITILLSFHGEELLAGLSPEIKKEVILALGLEVIQSFDHMTNKTRESLGQVDA
jgi:hypothetical protein